MALSYALLAMSDEKEEPRLYSAPPKGPFDLIAEEQREVHGLLLRWASWQMGRYKQATCASIEKRWDKGGRDTTPPATAPVTVDPMLLRAERAVLTVGVHSLEHGELLRQLYLRRHKGPEAERIDLIRICRLLDIRWEDLPRWTYDAREMVRNILAGLQA